MSEIKPIRSEADYEAALAEVERLWGAPSGTPAGDRLDVLATLIDAYEAEKHPFDPPDPIEAIKFRMEQQGLRQADIAAIVGGKNRASRSFRASGLLRSPWCVRFTRSSIFRASS